VNQSAIEIAENVRNGTASAAEAVHRSLDRIRATDGRLKAWVVVDEEGAHEQARRLEATDPARRGPLAGVPVGIKDIFDVAGLRTGLGAEFAAFTPQKDSAAVRRLREAGAIIMGKTHTTQFASSDPAPTVNPWNEKHTPGGSSSGSAAGVGAGQVPIALGSQTVGSVLRPAAYCGIVGLKPTHGRISAVGVFPLAPSFDHVGVHARSVAETAIVLGALAGYDAEDLFTQDVPVEDYLGAARSPKAPVVLLPSRFYRAAADDEIAAHIDTVARALGEAGATVKEVDIPSEPEDFIKTGRVVQSTESASVHKELYARHGPSYGPQIGGQVARGLEILATDYVRAWSQVRYVRRALIDLLGGGDVIMMPTAPSTAPADLGTTGNAVFCAPASFCGLPSISLPSGIGASGLPLAVQLIAAPWQESRLLSAAAWVEQQLAFDQSPPI
jgi:aspartyl-tRNA(Asn)/glutamyl-tRNA(Gln) amidotransferase subunit A